MITKNRIIVLTITALTAMVIFGIMILSDEYSPNRGQINSPNSTQGVYLAYGTGKTYSYMPSEIPQNIQEDEDHVYVPSRFRERQDRVSCEVLTGESVDNYRIQPVNEGEEAPKGQPMFIRVKYSTNIEPESLVHLYCNNERICAIPIVGKGVEQFQYEITLCLSTKETLDLFVATDNIESEHLAIRPMLN